MPPRRCQYARGVPPRLQSVSRRPRRTTRRGPPCRRPSTIRPCCRQRLPPRPPPITPTAVPTVFVLTLTLVGRPPRTTRDRKAPCKLVPPTARGVGVGALRNQEQRRFAPAVSARRGRSHRDGRIRSGFGKRSAPDAKSSRSLSLVVELAIRPRETQPEWGICGAVVTDQRQAGPFGPGPPHDPWRPARPLLNNSAPATLR